MHLLLPCETPDIKGEDRDIRGKAVVKEVVQRWINNKDRDERTV